MNINDDLNKIVFTAQYDQAQAGLCNLASLLGQFYKGLKDNGFSEEQAWGLSVKLAESFFAALGDKR